MSILPHLATTCLSSSSAQPSPASSRLSTAREYYKNTYLGNLKATVLAQGEDVHGSYIIPDRTIFHPQGGGQPDDDGSFTVNSTSYLVTKLVEERGVGPIKHYFEHEGSAPLLTGTEISMKINLENRKVYAILHSSGHFLSGIVESLFPNLKGTNGNHFPKQSFVEFSERPKSESKGASEASKPIPEKNELTKIIEAEITKVLKEKPSVIVNNESEVRTVQIEGVITYPCGGTHIDSFEKVSNITIRSVKNKKGKLKIGYDAN